MTPKAVSCRIGLSSIAIVFAVFSGIAIPSVQAATPPKKKTVTKKTPSSEKKEPASAEATIEASEEVRTEVKRALEELPSVYSKSDLLDRIRKLSDPAFIEKYNTQELATWAASTLNVELKSSRDTKILDELLSLAEKACNLHCVPDLKFAKELLKKHFSPDYLKNSKLDQRFSRLIADASKRTQRLPSIGPYLQVITGYHRLAEDRIRWNQAVFPGNPGPKYQWINGDSVHNLTLDLYNELLRGKPVPAIVGRDEEISRIMTILSRSEARIPLVQGDTGVGRGAIIQEIVRRGSTAGKRGLFVLEATPTSLTSKAGIQFTDETLLQDHMTAFLEEFVRLVSEVSGSSGIVVINDAENLTDGQLAAIRHFEQTAKDWHEVKIILLARNSGIGKITSDESLMKYVEPVIVDELNKKQTFQVLKLSWAPVLEKRFNVTFSEEVMEAIVDLAPDYQPESKRVRGPIRLMEDLAISARKAGQPDSQAATLADLYHLVAKANRMPVVPQDRVAFLAYMDGIRDQLKKEVIGQEHMIDAIMDRFSTSLTSETKKHSVVMIMGTSGVGKTYVAERLAERYYGTDSRTLVVDMTQLTDPETSVWRLFGAPNGVETAGEEPGIICKFLDGPGRGNNLIILNEVEKAHPKVLQQIMELLDRGEITGGDGKVRRLGRSLVVMTSNKNATKFFPPEVLAGLTADERTRRLSKITSDRMKAAFVEKESFNAEAASPTEVVQRIDAWIFAAPLLKTEAESIGELEGNKVLKSLLRTWKGTIEVDRRIYEAISDATFNSTDGVRELKRQVEKLIRDVTDGYYRKFKTEGNIKLTLVRTPNNPLKFSVEAVSAEDPARKVSVAGPKIATMNLMLDPEIRGRLKGMKQAMSERVFGQEIAIDKVTEAIKAQAANPSIRSPASIILLGTTGTGKTEIAREVAEKRYGNPLAFGRIDMGEFKNVQDVDNLFAPPKGLIGSDIPGAFEKLLIDNPDGCAIVFDEISNAGGGDLKQKNQILKAFYPLLEGEIWTSTVTGRKYSMKNYTFIFTGNDFEEHFQGVGADDLLESIYRHLISDPAAMEAELIKKGFPQAFLGRMKALVLMKPPSFEVKKQVARKLLGDWQKGFMAHQPFELSFAEGFENDLAELLFTSEKGGRSIRNFLDTSLGSLAADSIFDFDWEALGQEKGKVEVWIESVKPKFPFFNRRRDLKKAVLRIRSTQGGQVVYDGSLDFTRDAQFMTQFRKVDAWGTAFHEAGHAVLNDPKISGKELRILTIIPSGNRLGYAGYDRIPGYKTNFTREDLLSEIATLMAGGEAEVMMGRTRNTGVSGDTDQIRKLIKIAVLEGGLIPELGGAGVEKEGSLSLTPRQTTVYDEYVDQLIKDATALSRKRLKEEWVLVTLVAKDLIKNGSITAKRIRELRTAALLPENIDRYQYKKFQAVLKRFDRRCQALLLPEEE